MGKATRKAAGLTILSPIKSGLATEVSADANGSPTQVLRHVDALRAVLAGFGEDCVDSPFAKVAPTHLARLAIIDDVFYQGDPSPEEHLKSKYLFLSTNFNGSAADYFDAMLDDAADDVDEIWKHCIGFPGAQNRSAFHQYMTQCSIENGVFFSDYDEATVDDVLTALGTKMRFIDFVYQSQAMSAVELRDAFDDFMEQTRRSQPPARGTF